MSGKQEYPSYNGTAVSWADIEISFTPNGDAILETSDIAGIKSSSKLSTGQQKGASGGRPKKNTQGSVAYDGSVTFYREGYQKFLRALKKKAPTRGNQRRIGLVFFEILTQHTPFGDDEIYKRLLKGCRIGGNDMDFKEGDDPDQVEVPLIITEIAAIVDGEEVVLV